MSAKDEAIRAIEHVATLLAEELSPLNRRLALATLAHARENVEAIQETKRPRRKPVAQGATS